MSKKQAAQQNQSPEQNIQTRIDNAYAAFMSLERPEKDTTWMEDPNFKLAEMLVKREATLEAKDIFNNLNQATNWDALAAGRGFTVGTCPKDILHRAIEKMGTPCENATLISLEDILEKVIKELRKLLNNDPRIKIKAELDLEYPYEYYFHYVYFNEDSNT